MQFYNNILLKIKITNKSTKNNVLTYNYRIKSYNNNNNKLKEL